MKILSLICLSILFMLQAQAVEFYSYDLTKHELKLMNWDDQVLRQNQLAFLPGNVGTLDFKQSVARIHPTNLTAKPKALFGIYEREKSLPSSYLQRTAGMVNDNCTGTLVGPRHVLTAAHCVYSFKTRGFLESITFTPGQNKHNRPHGTFKVEHAYMPKLYEELILNKYDYALLVLEESVGYEVGWVGLSPFSKVAEEEVTIVGYPGDKTFATSWKVKCPARELRSHELLYKCDTYGGMSGAAIFGYPHIGARLPVVMGVHTTASYDGNTGRRMDRNLSRLLISWMKLEGHGEAARSGLGISLVQDEKSYVKKDEFKLYLTNSCSKAARVAVQYTNTSGLKALESWVHLEPGQRREVVSMERPNFRFYGEALDMSYRWSSVSKNCRTIPDERGVFCFVEREADPETQERIIEEELDCSGLSSEGASIFEV